MPTSKKNNKTTKPTKPQVNPELNGFDIKINEFGEIVSSFDVAKLNTFLDKNVEDKKFKGVDVVKRDEDDNKVHRLFSEDESLDKP